MGDTSNLTVFDILSEAVVAVDDNAKIVFVNKSAETLFGYHRTQLIDRPLDNLLPLRYRPSHTHLFAGFRESQVTARMKSDRAEVRGRRSDGTEFAAEASICRSAMGGSQVFIAVLRDVTERKAGEALLAAAEREQRAILDTCADGILVLSAETLRVLRANSRAADLLGREVSDLIGRHARELLANGESMAGDVIPTHGQHKPVLFEETVIRPDGTAIPVELSGQTTRLAFGPAIVCFLRDISLRKAHEQDLIEARYAAEKANRHKSVFLAGVSHELRTPLNAIIAFAEIIRDETLGAEATAKYREYAGDIASSGVHLVSVINDLIDLSRVEMGMMMLEPEQVDLPGLAEHCIRSLQPLIDEKSLRCSVRFDEAARWLRADPKAVRQMIINLLSNAIRHTQAGGAIEIAMSVDDDCNLVLGVEDTGTGIPRGRLASVTIPFNSVSSDVAARRAGTGLGLAITKRLLELHGGTMRIDSEEGTGTKVNLVFCSDRATLQRRSSDTARKHG